MEKRDGRVMENKFLFVIGLVSGRILRKKKCLKCHETMEIFELYNKKKDEVIAMNVCDNCHTMESIE